MTVGVALLGCVEERALFVPEVYEGQRARGALLAVEQAGAQTLLALDLEDGAAGSSVIEPYQDGDRTHLFLFASTPRELFWPTGPIPLAATQTWPVPTPRLAEYCGQVGEDGLNLGQCVPSSSLEPRLPLPDAAACLGAERCVLGQGTEARCLPCVPSPVAAPAPPEAPRPRQGPCPAGWAANGPLALCRPTWSPVPRCPTRYTTAAGCLDALPPCPTSTATPAFGPGDAWRAAIESGSPGIVRLGPGTFTSPTRLVLPPGRQVIGACDQTTLALPAGASIDRAGPARRLDNLVLAPGASVSVEGGQILQLHSVNIFPTDAIRVVAIRSATVALSDVAFSTDLDAILVAGQGAFVRAEGLSAQGGRGIFDLMGGSRLTVARSVVVGAEHVISNEDSDTSVSESHFSGFVDVGALANGGALRMWRSELIGGQQFALSTASSAIDLRELYLATQGDGGDPLALIRGGTGQVQVCEVVARKGEGLVLVGGTLVLADLWVRGGLNGLAARGPQLSAALQRVHIEESLMAATVNDGAEVEFTDLSATTRCEGLSSVSASRTQLTQAELILEGGDACEGPILGINLDRGARVTVQDLRISGAAKGIVSRGNESEVPEFIAQGLLLEDNAQDLELAAGRATLRGLRIATCRRWPSCLGLEVSPFANRTAELEVENFSVRDRATVLAIDGGQLRIKDGSLGLCPGDTGVAGAGLGPVPELALEKVRLFPCGAP